MFDDSQNFRLDRSATPTPRTAMKRLRNPIAPFFAAFSLLFLAPAYAGETSLSLKSEEASDIKALAVVQETAEKIAPQVHTLTVEGLGFSPRALLARPGDEIALENRSLYTLSLTLDRRGNTPAVAFNGRLDAQKNIRIPLKEPGDYILSSAEFSSLVLPIRVLTGKQQALPIALDATGRGHTPLADGKALVMVFTDNFYTSNAVEVAAGEKALNVRLALDQNGKWRLEANRQEKPDAQSAEPTTKAIVPPVKTAAAKTEPPKAAPKPAPTAEKTKPQAPKTEKPGLEKKKEEKPAPKPEAPKPASKPGTYNLKVIED